VWRRPANSSNVVIDSAGHLVSPTSHLQILTELTIAQIVQESPEELGTRLLLRHSSC
jgi:hypothetical protein